LTARDAVVEQLNGLDPRTIRRFLFLVDANGLTEGLERVWVCHNERDVWRYRNALDLRDRLEELKDADTAPERFPLAVVVVRSESAFDATVVDLTNRATVVVVSPQSVLQTLEPDGKWSDEFNLLNGNDFAELLDSILEARRRWDRDPSADEVPLFLAECALGQPLREKLPTDTALALWERLVNESATRAFFERNPRVHHAVHRQIQRSASIEAKLELDPDFAVFLWTSYFVQKYVRQSELFASEFFGRDVWAKYGVHDTGAVRETCERILVENPQQAVSQVRTAERSLTESPHRERLFLSLLGLDGKHAVTEALRIASDEIVSSFLTEACLRVLIPRVASGDTTLSLSRVRRLRATLDRKHLANRFPHYYERLRALNRLFRSLVELAERVETYHAERFERDLPILSISTWTDELYPKHLVPMGLLVDEILGKAIEMANLVGEAPTSLVREAARIRQRANVQFARLVRSQYVRWVAQHAPPPLLTVDFLDAVFIPYWRRLRRQSRSPLLVLFLFHGLRWDEWVTLLPAFSERLTRHRCVETRAMMTLLPSTRPYNTGALILGRFPSLADSGTVSALIAERLAAEDIPFAESVLDPRNGMPDVKEGVVLVNVAAAETGTRKTRPTGEVAAKIREETDAQVGDFLSRVPSRALVVAVSNGGTTEVTGPATPVREGVVDIQPRWVGLDGLGRGGSLPPEVAFFNAEATRLPNPSVSRCAFAPPGVWFSSDTRDSGRQFLSGGISLEEMIVPCAVFAPKRLAVRADEDAERRS
jgi:hypothetical protein